MSANQEEQDKTTKSGTLLDIPNIDDEHDEQNDLSKSTQQTVKELLHSWKKTKAAEQQQKTVPLPQQPRMLEPPSTPVPSNKMIASALGIPKFQSPKNALTTASPSTPATPVTPNTSNSQTKSEISPGFSPVPSPVTSSPQGPVRSQPFPSDQTTIYVSKRQKGNSILQHIYNVKLEYREDIIPDYIMSEHTCALYISCHYHLLHPDYIWRRMQALLSLFKLRVILCHVDTEDSEKAIMEITRLCMVADCTLILGFSTLEVARYLETYKLCENKSAKAIQVKVEDQYMPRVTDALTSIRSINKTDVVTLVNNLGSMKNVIGGSLEEYSNLPGFGEKKVKRLHDIFHAPFLPTTASNQTKSKSQTTDKKQMSIGSYIVTPTEQ